MEADTFSLIEAQPDSALASSAAAKTIASFRELTVIASLKNPIVSIDAAE